MKIRIEDILNKKNKEQITMLTCYDYSFARILDESGIDIILVGDSLANVILGMDETRNLSVTEMLNHTKAVALGVEKALIIADMPYNSYQKNPDKCVDYAKQFMELGADAVKIEWFGAKTNASSQKKDCFYVVKKLIKNKIPVMGHIGLTPQTAHILGGYKVQGKDEDSARNLLNQAKTLENLGVFSMVLECIPYQISKIITKKLNIPTIGIGAGKYCDGQVLVLYDLLGIYNKKRPKFVKVYRDFSRETKKAVGEFINDVKTKKFPSNEESFTLPLEKNSFLKDLDI